MNLISKLFKPKYLALDSEDSFHERADVSSHGYCRVCSRKNNFKPSKSRIFQSRFWIITIFLILVVLGINIAFKLFIRDYVQGDSCGSGFSTELSTSKSEISFRQVAFTGNINFYENGTSYLEREPGIKLYAGKPTDQIDENWRHLIHNRYFYFTETDVLDSWGPSELEEYYYELSPDNERRMKIRYWA